MLCTTNDMKFIPILVEGSGDAWGLDAEDVFKIIIKSTASLCDKTVLKKKLSPRPLKVTQHAAARTQYGSGYQQAMKILSNKYGDSTVGTRDHLLNFVTFYLEKPDACIISGTSPSASSSQSAAFATAEYFTNFLKPFSLRKLCCFLRLRRFQ